MGNKIQYCQKQQTFFFSYKLQQFQNDFEKVVQIVVNVKRSIILFINFIFLSQIALFSVQILNKKKCRSQYCSIFFFCRIQRKHFSPSQIQWDSICQQWQFFVVEDLIGVVHLIFFQCILIIIHYKKLKKQQLKIITKYMERTANNTFFLFEVAYFVILVLYQHKIINVIILDFIFWKFLIQIYVVKEQFVDLKIFFKCGNFYMKINQFVFDHIKIFYCLKFQIFFLTQYNIFMKQL
eukprot:TRINITY_DN7751_c0_g1_i2.p1 TRINITY_DN7751_c0_g1~~TRINITY_DN7751_c0_g1_i2.p1  ORF type:complete len:258 (-),score=-2.77 TRINITY_DN7751_c0_g1_i2:589-1299(-)